MPPPPRTLISVAIGTVVCVAALPAAASSFPSAVGAVPPAGPTGSGQGNVTVRIPPVVFTERDGWPEEVQRGRPVEGILRFAAGPGAIVHDVTVTADGGRIDCPVDERTTEDYVTTLACRLQPGTPAGAAHTESRDTTVVRLAVTTDDGTFTREFTHAVRDGRSEPVRRRPEVSQRSSAPAAASTQPSPAAP